jgi:hypothetical protein
MSTHFSAALFIKGDGLNLDEISQRLGVTPTYISEKGKRYGHAKTLCDFDAWSYFSPVNKERPFDEHIMALWDVVRPHIGYLRELKQKFQVNVSLDVKSSIPRFEIDHRCLELFTKLEIPFRVSVTKS